MSNTTPTQKSSSGRERRREGAYLVLFGLEFADKTETDITEVVTGLANDLKDEFEADLSDTDIKFIINTAVTAAAHSAEFIEYIDGNSPRRKVARLPKTVTALLKLGMCEMRYLKNAPRAVVLNECVELCKTYSADDKAFVNAILDGYGKKNEN